MKNKKKYIILFAIMMLATAMSIVLSFVPLEKACGNSGSCTIIQTSQYESIFGIKNAHLGLIAFPILALITILELRKSRKYQKILLNLGIILGSLFALYFLYLQFFILKAICKYCMVVDIGVLISLGIILFWEEKNLK